jgi:O-antigen/teichoic acid export membrane protein
LTDKTGPPRSLAVMARNGVLGFAGAGVAAVLGLALVVVVGRGLGPTGAGVFFQAVAAFTIATGLITLGADTALVKFLPSQLALGRSRDARPLVRIAAVPVVSVSLLIALIVYSQAGSIAGMLGESHRDDVAGYVRIFAPLLVIGAISALALQGIRGFHSLLPYVALQNVLIPGLRVVLIAAGVGLGLGSTAVAIGWALPLLLACILAVEVVRRRLRDLDRSGGPADVVTPRRVLARQFWSFSGPRGVATTLDLALTWSDVLVVGALLSAREAGIYAAVSRFATTGTLALQAMRLAIAPRLSALLSTGRLREAGDVYRASTVWVITTSWPLYLALATFGPVLLRVLGPEFASGGAALAIISLGMLVNVGTGSVQTVLLMAGRSSWLMANKAAALSVNLALNFLLVPIYGIAGAAFSWTVAIAVDNLAALVEVRLSLGLSPLGIGAGVSSAASLVTFGLFGLLVRSATGPTARGLLAYLGISSAVYLMLLWRQRRWLDLPTLRQTVPARRGAHVLAVDQSLAGHESAVQPQDQETGARGSVR